MESELYRLATYRNFPRDSPQHPIRLAEAGFYYEGSQDEVTCFHCKVKYKGWQENDNPFQIHLSLSNDCTFIKQHPKTQCQVGDKINLQERATNGDISYQTTAARDVPGDDYSSNEMESFNKSLENLNSCKNEDKPTPTLGKDEECYTSATLTQAIACSQPNPCLSDLKQTAIVPVNHDRNKTPGGPMGAPRYPIFANQTARISSYINWPNTLKQKPLELGESGFFYEGHGDNVRCFFCGGGLKEWEPEDSPWIEHARWFPKCPFLRQCKGDRFVSQVQSGVMDIIENFPVCTKQSEACNSTPGLTNNYSTIRMDDPAVVSVIEMGYAPKVVKNAIKVLKKENKEQNISSEVLLKAVWDMEDSGVENDEVEESSESDIKCVGQKETTIETENIPREREDLAKENENLKEMRRCKVCLDDEATIVFLPCGHLVSCASCAPALLKCPICRAHIRGTVKAILS